jgi:hypothetical protein
MTHLQQQKQGEGDGACLLAAPFYVRPDAQQPAEYVLKNFFLKLPVLACCLPFSWMWLCR